MSFPSQSKIAFAIALVVLIFSAGGTLYFKAVADSLEQASERDQARPPPLVDVYHVVYQKIPLQFHVRDELKGIEEVIVSAEVEGQVISKPIREGDVVKAGEVLSQIDSTFHELAVQAASARLAKAQAAYSDAQEVLKHLESLGKEQRRPLEYTNAVNVREGAQADVDLTTAELNKARELLKRCTVTSPIDGQVAEVFYEKGELLRPYQPVAEIVNLSQMKMIVELTEMEVAHLGREPRITVTSEGAPGMTFSGKIEANYPKANPLTRRIPVEIIIDNQDMKLRSNTFANCLIESEMAEAKMLIPAKGVLHDFGATYCFLAVPHDKGNKVRRQAIKTTPVGNLVSVVEVIEGLQEGELIITSGLQGIRSGQEVATQTVSLGTESLVSTDKKPEGL